MASTIPIFISAGEASGDMYGALLIQALRERLGEVHFYGCGGAKMKAAGCETLVEAHQITMVGLAEVLPGLPRVWKAFRLLRRTLRKRRPALAVLIDFPDFNLRLAKRFKRAGVPVLYFVAPQVWAWRRGRLALLREFVDRLLCIFPFEEKFFQKAGVAAEFVGHPLAGRVAPAMTAPEFRNRWGIPEKPPLIALLPGSRRKEISLNLPPLLEMVRSMSQQGEHCFVLPAAATVAGDLLRARVENSGLPIVVVEDCTYDAVAHASVAVVASGTATIETALLGTPMVVVYKVTPATWWLGRKLVQTPFYSMVNLVADEPIVPELIQDRFQPELVASHVRRLLEDPAARDRMRLAFRQVAARLNPPNRVGVAPLSPIPASKPLTVAGVAVTSVAAPSVAVPGDFPDRVVRKESADAIQRFVAVTESMLQGRGLQETRPQGRDAPGASPEAGGSV
ncbi:MAG: lipid-A-disaccharide synthase [Acidobacteria bacterium]|nr:lipid-A-disaccharide synthase [Acidobacteriota bacterium]